MSKVQIKDKDFIKKINNELGGFVKSAYFNKEGRNIEVNLFIPTYKKPENKEFISKFSDWYFGGELIERESFSFIVSSFSAKDDRDCPMETGVTLRLNSTGSISL